MPLTSRPLTAEAATAEALPFKDRSDAERLVRYEMHNMVKQLHQLRRRSAGIESSASQEAIESVITACVELDEFLRSVSAREASDRTAHP